MIKIRDLHAYYGPIEALKGIDMVIEKGKITCLIGSNGAGKSTLMNSMIPFARPSCTTEVMMPQQIPRPLTLA